MRDTNLTIISVSKAMITIAGLKLIVRKKTFFSEICFLPLAIRAKCTVIVRLMYFTTVLLGRYKDDALKVIKNAPQSA